MFIAVVRDLSLDLTLESEARTILIIVGIAVGILLLATAVILQAERFRKFGRYIFGIPTPISNQAQLEESIIIGTTPRMSQSFPIPHPQREQYAQKPNQARRITAFFASIRKNVSVPSRPMALYQGGNGLYHSPPHNGHPFYVSHPQKTVPPANFVSPHIVGWTRVADSVVGPHPNAQPLSSRVATQAEINMISGHVHIPWAYNDSQRPQPIPVKVQKPVTAYQLPPTQPPKPRELDTDAGNLRAHSRAIFGSVSHATSSSSKGKGVRQPRGKENMQLAVPSFATRHDRL